MSSSKSITGASDNAAKSESASASQTVKDKSSRLKTPKAKTPPDGQRVNLRMLASHLNLSQTTVSLVLNDSPSARSIPQETRQRVLDGAKKYHYRPNYFARSLRQSRSMSVGVIAPDLSEGYFTLVMNGVEQHLLQAHYFYFTASHYWHDDLIQEYPRKLIERAVDGLLLLNTPVVFPATVPIVAISAHDEVEGVTNIVIDHHEAASLALHHLYELGHRKIAFMRGPEFIVDSEYRWNGILEVALELGLSLRPELILRLDSRSWSPELGYGPMAELLARTRDFTAIFCFNDIAAIGCIRAIQDAGLNVPDDISVVGFDDIIHAAYYKPSLTTVHQPLREMGTAGAEILLDRIASPNKIFPREIVMQPMLMKRESSGPVKQTKSKAGR